MVIRNRSPVPHFFESLSSFCDGARRIDAVSPLTINQPQSTAVVSIDYQLPVAQIGTQQSCVPTEHLYFTGSRTFRVTVDRDTAVLIRYLFTSSSQELCVSKLWLLR
ncbi:MAG: hypothetical protein ACRC62_33735 [Microcoleus sp.]